MSEKCWRKTQSMVHSWQDVGLVWRTWQPSGFFATVRSTVCGLCVGWRKKMEPRSFYLHYKLLQAIDKMPRTSSGSSNRSMGEERKEYMRMEPTSPALSTTASSLLSLSPIILCAVEKNRGERRQRICRSCVGRLPGNSTWLSVNKIFGINFYHWKLYVCIY